MVFGGFRKYFMCKIFVYLIIFLFVVMFNWLFLRLMFGNLIEGMMVQVGIGGSVNDVLVWFYERFYGFDQFFWKQFLNFWLSFFYGDLGYSIFYCVLVVDIIKYVFFYDIVIFLFVIVLSWLVGNWFGVFVGKNKMYDRYVMFVFYFFVSMFYFWFVMLLVYVVGVEFGWFFYQGVYDLSFVFLIFLSFVGDFLKYWILLFFSFFMVMIGSWVIGMRNMIIYEFEVDYVCYFEVFGGSERFLIKYVYRNVIFFQVIGLVFQLGFMVVGVIVIEIVFNYFGIGVFIMNVVLSQDYFFF